MGKKPPSPPTLEGLKKHWTKLFDALDSESDFICMVVATSYVDYALGALLERYFVEGGSSEQLLRPIGGALGPLHAKAGVTYCSGLISKGCKANIDRIGEIRNSFAHSLGELSFSDPAVADVARSLTLPAPYHDETKSADDPTIAEVRASERKRFEYVVTVIVANLNAAAHHVKRCNSPVDCWQ
jgi:hypothetical protein